MLEKIPREFGELLRKFRAGSRSLTYLAPEFETVPESIQLSSAGIDSSGRINARHTADGPGVSPPLAWRDLPERAASLVLLVEDADSPTPAPLVHAIVLDIPPAPGMLMEGELPTGNIDGEAPQMGRNSYFRRRYLPPDPPPGHGTHHYVFQLYAISTVLPADFHPGRGALVAAIRDRILARGILIGHYSR